jgi:sugar lactone lactonase YvrE
LKTFKIITLLFITILSSCVKEDVDNEVVVEPVKTSNLAISSINPISGPKNTTVTITGTDFSPNIKSNKVTINGQECPIISASSTILYVTIPRGAGTGNIVVTVDGNTKQGPEFKYEVTPSVVSTFIGGIFYDGVTIDQLKFPHGITIDTDGNLYVTDRDNHKIRKITPTPTITNFAGSTQDFLEGNGTAAKFNNPASAKFDFNGNLYVADSGNQKIRKITANGDVSTFAGSSAGFLEGSASGSQFNNPSDIAFDAKGNAYVTDFNNQRIRKITPQGVVSTFAGSSKSGFDDGIGTSAQFDGPVGVAVDANGNVYVTDYNNHRIRKITANGEVSTFAGSTIGSDDGIGKLAKFNNPRGITIDSSGNLYVTDQGSHRIRKITSKGVVTTLAGNDAGNRDGIGSAALFNVPIGIAIDVSGNLYVADGINNSIRKITQD